MANRPDDEETIGVNKFTLGRILNKTSATSQELDWIRKQLKDMRRRRSNGETASQDASNQGNASDVAYRPLILQFYAPGDFRVVLRHLNTTNNTQGNPNDEDNASDDAFVVQSRVTLRGGVLVTEYRNPHTRRWTQQNPAQWQSAHSETEESLSEVLRSPSLSTGHHSRRSQPHNNREQSESEAEDDERDDSAVHDLEPGLQGYPDGQLNATSRGQRSAVNHLLNAIGISDQNLDEENPPVEQQDDIANATTNDPPPTRPNKRDDREDVWDPATKAYYENELRGPGFRSSTAGIEQKARQDVENGDDGRKTRSQKKVEALERESAPPPSTCEASEAQGQGTNGRGGSNAPTMNPQGNSIRRLPGNEPAERTRRNTARDLRRSDAPPLSRHQSAPRLRQFQRRASNAIQSQYPDDDQEPNRERRRQKRPHDRQDDEDGPSESDDVDIEARSPKKPNTGTRPRNNHAEDLHEEPSENENGAAPDTGRGRQPSRDSLGEKRGRGKKGRKGKK